MKSLSFKRLWSPIKFLFKILIVVGVFVGLFSYAMFQGEFVSWFLFYSVATLVVLMLLYALIPLGSFVIERNVGDGALPSGSELTVDISVRRKWPFPFLYLTVEDEVGNAIREQMPSRQSRMIFYPTMKKKLTFSYTIPEVKRGEYEFLGFTLSTSDMFGIFEKRKFIALNSNVLVYPRYHNIERWSAYEKHDSETDISSKDFIEDVTSAAGAREYVPGDKLTSIDWKVTARTNKLMTKEFEEYIGQNFLIVFNNAIPDDHFGTVEAYEKGIELVTSIIMYAYTRHLDVGLWTLGSHKRQFELDTGGDHQKRMVKHLAQLKGDQHGDFAARLSESEVKVPSGVSMIIVSVELTRETLERVKVLVARRVQVYFALMDKGSEIDEWEKKRLQELRKTGVEVYQLSDGNIDKGVGKV
ncbi:DUF58 domain-containing protein [Salipaludibacillus sp. CF4.18]|uniref:DUF58 domain-containing protein n=1 Tax=Salipaludibacillus sp. CF4.18 TaxID=3373081 RepID=UPI003EE45705